MNSRTHNVLINRINTYTPIDDLLEKVVLNLNGVYSIVNTRCIEELLKCLLQI